MGPLKTKMYDEMILRNFSRSTIRSYLLYIQRLANYHRKSPAILNAEDIKEFLIHLIKVEKAAAATVGLAHNAFRFFYTTVMNRREIIDEVPRGKKHRPKPIVLGVSEVRRILDATPNLKQKTVLMTVYASGLRVSEVTHLRVSDIDSERMQIFIRNAKGRKDRYALLSPLNLHHLRLYWRKYRPTDWLFYSAASKEKPYSIRSVQKVFQEALKKAGIGKKASVHTLRHSFATHLLEQGTGFHHVQLLLGHASPRSTSVYLHVQKKDLLKIRSPFDRMLCHEPLSQASGTGRGGRYISRGRTGVSQTQRPQDATGGA